MHFPEDIEVAGVVAHTHLRLRRGRDLGLHEDHEALGNLRALPARVGVLAVQHRRRGRAVGVEGVAGLVRVAHLLRGGGSYQQEQQHHKGGGESGG